VIPGLIAVAGDMMLFEFVAAVDGWNDANAPAKGKKGRGGPAAAPTEAQMAALMAQREAGDA